jgi:hypothetical protein
VGAWSATLGHKGGGGVGRRAGAVPRDIEYKALLNMASEGFSMHDKASGEYLS